MAQVFWEQISNNLPELGEALTGSLSLSGSLNVSGAILIDDVDIITLINNSSGIFKQTGSFYSTTNDLKVTGSMFIELDGVEDIFKISVNGTEKLEINSEGTLKFIPQSTEPTPVAGGIYFGDDNNYYMGFMT